MLAVVFLIACDDAHPQRPLEIGPYRQPCVHGWEGVFDDLCNVTADAATHAPVSFDFSIEGFTPAWGQLARVAFVGYDNDPKVGGLPPMHYVATSVTVLSTEAAGTPFTLDIPPSIDDSWFATLTDTSVLLVDHSTTVSCTADMCAQLLAIGKSSATVAFQYATGDTIVATEILQVGN
jgi:hypothetical protein